MFTQIKKVVRKILNLFGYEIRKSTSAGAKDEYFAYFLVNRISHILYVGANVGQYVSEMQARYKNVPITLYEADPELAAILKSKFEDNDLVTIKNVAVAESEGKSPFYRTSLESNKRLSSSMLKMNKLHEEWSEGSNQIDTIEVNTIKLDNENFPDNAKILLKIDIQGMELPALRGSLNLLKRNVLAIDTEVSFHPLYQNETNWIELIKFLDEQGFVLFGCEPWGIYYKSHGQLLQADLQFVRRELLEK